MLTSAQGINEPIAAATWQGLQDASQTTSIKVEYLPVAGPQTIENSTVFLNTLAQRGCNIIIGAGPTPAAAVVHAAPSLTHTTFITVGQPGTAAHVTAIAATSTAAIRAAVDHAVTATVQPSRAD
jgi:hypothetical protein